MILRSISVANWRCFLEPIVLGPFTDGLNIVHAPNGTGKSTLFEAMRHALLDGHRVSGKEVEALRPWGRNLNPKVIVEFVHGGTEYRITKQFLDGQSALLERKEGGRYRSLAEGSKADEETRALITQNPPGKGLARIENWGLAQVLWAPQGSLVLSSLSDDLVTNIRSMLSAQVSGKGTNPIEKKIEERYSEFFSPTGKPKTGKQGPRLAQLEQELKDQHEVLREAQNLCQAFDDASRRVEDLRSRGKQSRYDAEEIGKALQGARLRADKCSALLAEKDQRSERAKAAEAQHHQLEQRINLIRQTDGALVEAKKIMVALEVDVPLKARESQDRIKEAERTRTALEDARKGRKDVEDAARLAEEAQQYVDGAKAHAKIVTLIERIQAIQKLLAERKHQRSELVAPDAKTLRALRKLITERDEAQVRLEASLITLEVTPDMNAELDIVAGELTGPMPLTAGVPARVQGSPEVVAVIPGVARLRASGPTGSADEHRNARTRAQEKIQHLTAPFGIADLDALETLAEKAALLEATIGEAETQLETLLTGRTLEDLIQERSILETALTKIIDGHPDWTTLAPDPQVLRSKAGDIKRLFIAKVENAEIERDKAQGALSAATGQEETLVERLKDARTQVTSLETALTEYVKDGKQMPEREAELRQFAMSWDAARTRLAEIEIELESFQDDPVSAAQKLEQQLEAVSQEARQAREQEVREETRLEGLSARGPYSLLTLVEEKVSRLTEDVQSEQLRMEAIRLLRDTVVQCKMEVITSIAQPVETAATRTFQRIASRRLGRILIGEALQPTGVVLDSLNDTVEIEDISGGEQEQLYLATRLALANVLARDERQLVALDDVLTASDAGRLARVMTILEESAERLQILVLTCHPERYRGLKAAQFFDLENILLNHA